MRTGDMNKARAMLDALMGPGRDEKDKSKVSYKDKSVCKGFLIGFCPYDKSVLGGKRTLEVCKKIHSDVMQAQYLADPKADEYRRDCEYVSLRDLEKVILEREGHIANERGRIREDYARRKKPLPPDVNIKLSAMKREASILIERAEALDDDKIREKEQLVKQSEELKQETEDYQKDEVKKAADMVQLEQLCEVCGTAYATEEDKEKHLAYRVHWGYEKVIARLDELKVKKDEIDKEREAERKEKRKKDWEKAQEKDKEREGRGDDAKAGEKVRDNSRDGSREKDRGKDRDRSQSRDKGKDRNRDRSRSRNRAKDQGQDRSRGMRDRDSREPSRGRDRRERNRSRDRRERSRSRGDRGRNGRR